LCPSLRASTTPKKSAHGVDHQSLSNQALISSPLIRAARGRLLDPQC
jgi:hypothetical protein